MGNFLEIKMLFEKTEYKDRLKKVKKSMQKQGIDLLVSHDPSNMNYYALGIIKGPSIISY